MKLRSTLFTVVLLLLFINGKSQKTVASPDEQFKGLWILDKYESFDSLTGKWIIEPSRMGYIGYVLFDGIGHMAIQITPADYNEFDLNKKADSLGKKIVSNYHSNNLIYFAECKVEGKELDNKILSSTNPESIGAIVTRDFEIKGKTLLLTPKNKLNGSKIRMKWVKVQ
jgi:hypothetical protein